MPLPPSSSSTVMPCRPSAPICGHSSIGKRSSRSISAAIGAILSSAKSRTVVRSMSISGPRSWSSVASRLFCMRRICHMRRAGTRAGSTRGAQRLRSRARFVGECGCATMKARDGAVEKTRTSTEFPPQRPQRCASTSSATTARQPTPAGERARVANPRYHSNRDGFAGWRAATGEWATARSSGASPRARALCRGDRGDGGARRGDPAGTAGELVWLFGAPAALHRRHQGQRGRSLDPDRLPVFTSRARRAIHLSRAGTAGGLCDARPDAARRAMSAALSGGWRNG